MEENEYLTVTDMAKYLRIGTTNAYKLVKEPGFPAMRVTRDKYIIPRKALDEWVEKRMRKE